MSVPSTGPNPAPGFRLHPDHEITLKPFAGIVTVVHEGTLVASSRQALELRETGHAPVFYLPMDDIDSALLQRSAHVTHCPFKGEASYWNIVIGDHEIDNALWAYETPYDEVLELAGMAAFYASKVTVDVNEA